LRSVLNLARKVDRWFEYPMIVLSVAWIALLVVEFVSGLSPAVLIVFNIIWGAFIIEFGIKFAIAPRKARFFRRNWLGFIALFVPAFRVFRLFAIARAARVVRVVATINRGRVSIGKSFGRRQFGFVVVTTVIVIFVGGAALYAFESRAHVSSYGEALWYTGMIVTTLGADFWPQTTEGRILGFLLAVYSMGVFGYIAATLASYFVEVDANSHDAATGGDQMLLEMREELRALREEIARR
jgi:voltage-gated potassium channel